MTGIDSWSTTPATNATADGGSINWAEGQPPSSVNNTARQMCADIRARMNDLVWFQYGTGDQGAGNLAVPAVYSSGTVFTIAGADVTAAYHIGRRVRAVGVSTGTIYGTISNSVYAPTTTTVTVVWDTGSLSNETLVISLSQIPVTGYPVPSSGTPLPRGYIDGLALSNNGGTPNSKIDVAAGSCRDSSNTVNISPIAGTIDCGATGANGLDTGSLGASTWYHAFAISKADGTTALLASTSPSAPTMPSGYLYKRRIGSFKTDGSSHIITFTQVGEHFYWNTALFDKSNAAPSGSWELVTLTVPTGVKVRPIFGIFGNSTDASNHFMSLNSGGSTPTGNVTIIQNTLTTGVSSSGSSVNCYYTNTSAQIYFEGSSANMVYNIFTNGWIDDRGRNA